MGLACAWSVGLLGVDGVSVEVEAHIGAGLPGVHLVGLPDAAVHEAKDRVRAAVTNSGEQWPNRRITLGLSPATLRKVGSGYDVALACAALAAAGAVPVQRLVRTVLLGELALDGRVRSVHGVLPAMLAARRAGMQTAVVPAAAVQEAALVTGLRVRGAARLADVLAWLRGDDAALTAPVPVADPPAAGFPELADVLGQDEARWALEVAAAGGHHLLLTGPPGTGKTMLARRMVGLLPELSRDEALEVTAVHSIAGGLAADAPLITVPPFVAPHHTSTMPALVGGGSGLARPGAISRAHRGVLFLDEVVEFAPHVLESLRTPTEEGEVRLARADGVVRYPARFQLVMAANPCPCAPPNELDCTCSPSARRRYQSRLSGPLLDRVDVRVRTLPVTAMHRDGADSPESSAPVRTRVLSARAAARERWRARDWRCNAEVPGPVLRREFRLPRDATAELDSGLRVGAVTARGADRCLRVAWTLGDLAGAVRPDSSHVGAALALALVGRVA